MNVTISGMDSTTERIKAICDSKIRKEITGKLADIGEVVAADKFDMADYAGYNDVVVSVKETSDGHEVVASGSQVLFIEYGTGKKQAEHPTGKYKHGSMYTTPQALSNDYWLYKGSLGKGGCASTFNLNPQYNITSGVPAQNCMYETEKVIRDSIQEVAKEVLGI